MKWKKFTLTTTTEAVDLISYTLDELGIEGIEIEDNIPLTEKETKGMFIDILPELPPDDGTARVSFYLDEDEDTEEKLKAVREGLEEIRQFVNIGTAKITESETDDKDWINNWKQYFKPFTVDHILIKPTWEEIPEEHKDKLLIQIDPGTAFGTGKHETTQLCIRQLEKYVKPGDTMLDMGCGSGILSVAGLLLGAGSAVGVDIDALAVKTAVANAEINHVGDKFTGICGNLADKVTGTFDVVVANIVADVVILLTKDAPRFMKPDTVYIMSGIIDTREDDVLACLADKFEIIDRKEEKGWVALAAKLK